MHSLGNHYEAVTKKKNKSEATKVWSKERDFMGVDEFKKIQEQDDQMLQPIDLSRKFTQNGNEENKIATEEMDYSEENNPYEDMTVT